MLKSFFLKVIQVVALTVLIAQFTFSSALAVETPSSEEAVETPSSEEAVETPSSEEAVETPSSEEAVETPSLAVQKLKQFIKSHPPDVYNFREIEEFNRDVYGQER